MKIGSGSQLEGSLVWPQNMFSLLHVPWGELENLIKTNIQVFGGSTGMTTCLVRSEILGANSKT